MFADTIINLNKEGLKLPYVASCDVHVVHAFRRFRFSLCPTNTLLTADVLLLHCTHRIIEVHRCSLLASDKAIPTNIHRNIRPKSFPATAASQLFVLGSCAAPRTTRGRARLPWPRPQPPATSASSLWGCCWWWWWDPASYGPPMAAAFRRRWTARSSRRRGRSTARSGRGDDVPLTDPRLAPRAAPAPEQIALAASSDATSVWVSWVTGEAQVGSHLTPLDPSTVRSEVWYSERPSPTAAAAGDVSGHYPHVARGKAEVYSQLYPYPGLLNYTSGAIHHVRLRGLRPATRYYYRCGDSSVRGGAGLSGELSFETLPSSAAAAYPRRVAVVGDLGLTGNSTSTVEHLARNDPSLVVVVGDMTYANQYRTTGGRGVPCFSCSFPDAPLRESYQPRWDGWGRLVASTSDAKFSSISLFGI